VTTHTESLPRTPIEVIFEASTALKAYSTPRNQDTYYSQITSLAQVHKDSIIALKTFTKPHMRDMIMQTQHRTTPREKKNFTYLVFAKPENNPFKDINANQAKQATTRFLINAAI
jgi:hypothetical protein